MSYLRNHCLFWRNADVLFSSVENKMTGPIWSWLYQATGHHSFYLFQKWNLEPARQEPPDQWSLAHGPDRPVAPRERDPATSKPCLRTPPTPWPQRGLGQPLILHSSLELFLWVCTERCLIHELFKTGSTVSKIYSAEPCSLMALKLVFSFLTYIYNPFLCMNGDEVKTLDPPNSHPQTEHHWPKRPVLCISAQSPVTVLGGSTPGLCSGPLILSLAVYRCQTISTNRASEKLLRAQWKYPVLFLYVCISFLWSFAFPCEILNDYLSFFKKKKKYC